LHDLRQLGAVEELHHEVRRPAFERVEVDHLDDVRMLERGRHLRLALEARRGVGVRGDLRAEDLDGVAAGEAAVRGPRSPAHAAATDAANDPVGAGDDLTDAQPWFRHLRPIDLSAVRSGCQGIIATPSTMGEKTTLRRNSTQSVGERGGEPFVVWVYPELEG